MDFWGDIWNFIWVLFWAFAFIAYVFALVAVFDDLFRDRNLSGWWKAVWIIFLVFVPFLTVLVYLIARGDGMAERSRKKAEQSNAAAEQFIRSVAGTSPSEEIAKAKALLDAGTIGQQEYEGLKSRALL